MPLFLTIRLFAIEQTGKLRTNYRLAVSVNPLDSQVGKTPIGFSGLCIKERFEGRGADL